jgi:AcrR family transcriptional regulator
MIDRRVERTLKSMHQALVSLILEKGYDAITIKDIVDRANVGRSTFYAYYNSKDELLEAGLKELHRSLASHQKAIRTTGGAASESKLKFSRALFEHAAGYHDIYRAMMGKHGGTVVMLRMRALLSDLVRDDFKSIAPDKRVADIPRGAVIEFVVGSIVSVLTWWLDEKTKLSAAEVDAIFRRLTLPSIFPSES